MPFLFEKLRVYHKALDLADKACRITEDFPGGSFYLRDQFNRAALSISANSAEGNGRFTKAEQAESGTGELFSRT